MQFFCVRVNPHTGIPYAKALRREGCALAGNLEGGRAFFGTLSPSQNRFHYFSFAPQHFLYFLPLPHGQGSFLPIFLPLRIVLLTESVPSAEVSVG